MRRRLLAFVLILAGCREGAAPFAIENGAATDSTGQITFNLNGDHVPAWNKAGDSIYYSTSSLVGLPAADGILLSVPRRGGSADVLLKSIQQGVTRNPRLVAPALSPDGSSLAFFELTDVRDHEFDVVSCPFNSEKVIIDTVATSSVLQSVLLRVRTLGSTSSNDAAQHVVSFPGRTLDTTRHPNGLPYVIVNVAYPFQRLFEGEHVPIFRASWSPIGKTLAYSNGASIQVWDVTTNTTLTLPGTDSGILPAWSPDGSWIAFSKPFTGSTQTVTCSAFMFGAQQPSAVFDRTIYTPLSREGAQLFLIHPDGTGLKPMGEGEAPAWTSDSRTLVVHRNQRLYRIAIDTGAATEIPNTSDAFEPALSRNDKFLAFVRKREIANTPLHYNIWVSGF